jgi:hypothetical protein
VVNAKGEEEMKVVIRTKAERRWKRKSHELALTIPNHLQCKIYK